MSKNVFLTGATGFFLGSFLAKELYKYIDTFGDKPQCLSLGSQSRSAEGGKEFKGLVALSVNTEVYPEENKIYRKQTPIASQSGHTNVLTT